MTKDIPYINFDPEKFNSETGTPNKLRQNLFGIR